jgi:ketosteroid isomerase-like protein
MDREDRSRHRVAYLGSSVAGRPERRGKEQLLSQVLATLRGWLDYRSEIRETVDAGGDVVVVLHETARLRDSDTALDRDLFQVWTVREGAAVFFRVFRTKQAALEVLGLRE